jgi:hypothetical protein
MVPRAVPQVKVLGAQVSVTATQGIVAQWLGHMHHSIIDGVMGERFRDYKLIPRELTK